MPKLHAMGSGGDIDPLKQSTSGVEIGPLVGQKEVGKAGIFGAPSAQQLPRSVVAHTLAKARARRWGWASELDASSEHTRCEAGVNHFLCC